MKHVPVRCLLTAAVFCIVSRSAVAASVTLNPVDDAFAVDQPKDGVFDSIFPTSPSNIVGGNNSALYRSALEFSLSSIPAHSVITSATLGLRGGFAAGSSGQVGVEVNAYVGNGVAELNDMYINNVVAGPTIFNLGPIPDLTEFDVTNTIKLYYGVGAKFAGFTLSGDPSEFVLSFASEDNDESARPTLNVVFNPVPEPSTITLLLVVLAVVGSRGCFLKARSTWCWRIVRSIS
jgi:hypothetical protein